MVERKLHLTDRSVADLLPPSPPADRYLARDTELAGFFVQVGQRTKTFMVQGDLRIDGTRQSVRLKIGVAGRMTTRKARALGMEVLGKIARGEDPRERRKVEPQVPLEPTLREAWAHYREAHMERKGRGARTIGNYRDHVERLMGDWQDRLLTDLGKDPRLVIQRHEAISKANGPYTADPPSGATAGTDPALLARSILRNSRRHA